MSTPFVSTKSHAAVAILCATFFALQGCSHNPSKPPAATVDLEPFKTLARSSVCADLVNRLCLIDGQVVFWDRSGTCADAAYASTLFGERTDVILGDTHDSIIGPVKSYPSPVHRAMFDTILANRDQPDLGLGPGHTVTAVPF